MHTADFHEIRQYIGGIMPHCLRIHDCVMPAQAGIQEYPAWAAGEAAWIPGLAQLARNDDSFSRKSVEVDY